MNGSEFTAQIFDQGRVRAGMNPPLGKDNAQILLNVMHWLSSRLYKLAFLDLFESDRLCVLASFYTIQFHSHLTFALDQELILHFALTGYAAGELEVFEVFLVDQGHITVCGTESTEEPAEPRRDSGREACSLSLSGCKYVHITFDRENVRSLYIVLNGSRRHGRHPYLLCHRICLHSGCPCRGLLQRMVS